MIGFIVRKLIGSKNDRELKRIKPWVGRINAFEAELQKVSDEVLRQKTAAWKEELSRIEDKDELARRLDRDHARGVCGGEERLPPPAGPGNHGPRPSAQMGDGPLRRAVDRRHALHTGRIAEMATGEGKTLVATLPVYLNALTGRGVHVVTVNDYLAARDSEWMGAVYTFLGLTVGCILHDQPPARPPRAIRLRHHLRHQRRVRVRLPARQRHGHSARKTRCSAAIITPSWTRWTPS